MDKFNIDLFTSKLAIGSLWILSTFLFTCGLYNIYPFVEYLSSTKTWDAIVTIPVLIFAYTIGGIIIHLSQVLLFPLSKKNCESELTDFVRVALKNNEFLVKRYESTKYQYDFFSAIFPTCLYLGFSVVFGSIRTLYANRSLEYTLIILGFITLFCAFPIYKILKNLREELKALADSVKT